MASDLDRYLLSEEARRQSAPLDSSRLRPGDEIDGFTAVALLGRGASGEVWRVHDEAEKRDVALKLFIAGSRERFLAEQRLLSSLRHPNIVRVDRSGSFHDAPYFTMELLRPLPVRLTARQIAALGLDLCRALTRLHALGIIHRDLKPDNLLVAPDGHYVLADLGIAALHEPALAAFVRGEKAGLTLADGADHALGTPRFAAPEQLAGQRVTPAADLHAIGVLFDTLFAHRPPLLWRLLILRLTSTLPAFRLPTLSRLRGALYVLREIRTAAALTGLALLAALFAIVHRPADEIWIPLPGNAEVEQHPTPPEYTLQLPENKQYVLPSFKLPERYRRIGERWQPVPWEIRVSGPGVLRIGESTNCIFTATNGAVILR